MPPLPIAHTLITSLPWLSPQARAVIHALAAERGAIVTADEMAARVGLQNRFQLARLLQREGTPAFGQLADWICLLQWLWEAEEKRVTLLQLSRATATDAATCYRRCKRILGVPWSVARARGVHAALIQFLERCRCPVTRKPAALARSALVMSGATTVTRRTWRLVRRLEDRRYETVVSPPGQPPKIALSGEEARPLGFGHAEAAADAAAEQELGHLRRLRRTATSGLCITWASRLSRSPG